MLDYLLPIIGFTVGLLVGMTGIGAGAIMTPLLLFTGLPPIYAVGTDLIHSAISKSLGAFLHVRRGNVSYPIVGYLLLGGVPALVFGSIFIVTLRRTYGFAYLNLLVSISIATVLVLAGAVYLVGFGKQAGSQSTTNPPSKTFNRGPLTLVGFLVGLVVNMTSIGAGSLLMPYLMRTLRSTRKMVGTDLMYGFLFSLLAGGLQLSIGNVQAITLLLLLVGSTPGTYLGVRFNDRIHLRGLRVVLSVLIMLAGIIILIKYV